MPIEWGPAPPAAPWPLPQPQLEPSHVYQSTPVCWPRLYSPEVLAAIRAAYDAQEEGIWHRAYARQAERERDGIERWHANRPYEPMPSYMGRDWLAAPEFEIARQIEIAMTQTYYAFDLDEHPHLAGYFAFWCWKYLVWDWWPRNWPDLTHAEQQQLERLYRDCARAAQAALGDLDAQAA